jgi:hypothetical protein
MKLGLGEDVKRKLRELGWTALIVFLRWLVERLVSGGGGSSSDAGS